MDNSPVIKKIPNKKEPSENGIGMFEADVSKCVPFIQRNSQKAGVPFL